MKASARRVGQLVAAKHAEAVDRESRFPVEAVSALRAASLLGAAVPRAFGGQSASLESLAEACYELAQHCANTAMVFAMHQIQVACLVRHVTDSAWHRGFLARLAERQLLIASATTEGGSGGDVRQSQCAVAMDDGSLSIGKSGCVISYAQQADAILVTARRSIGSAPSDQVAILVERAQYRLDPLLEWDALGMRGTCSQSYDLGLEAAEAQIVPAEFADIAARTMLPVSHILWAAVWAGIATAACKRARTVLRRRTVPGASQPPVGASRLADALSQLQSLRAQVADAVRRFEQLEHDPASVGSIPFTLSMNQLKLAASSGAIRIVGEAMLVAGLSGYRNNSPESLGRHLRDVHSAALMISNDRILANCAALLGAYRGEESLFQ